MKSLTLNLVKNKKYKGNAARALTNKECNE